MHEDRGRRDQAQGCERCSGILTQAFDRRARCEYRDDRRLREGVKEAGTLLNSQDIDRRNVQPQEHKNCPMPPPDIPGFPTANSYVTSIGSHIRFWIREI